MAILGLSGFVIRENMTRDPVVNLKVFRNRTYATGIFMMTILGFVLLRQHRVDSHLVADR